MNTSNLISIPKFAQTFKGKKGQGIVTVPYIYQLIKKGRLEVVEIGGRMFIDRDAKVKE